MVGRRRPWRITRRRLLGGGAALAAAAVLAACGDGGATPALSSAQAETTSLPDPGLGTDAAEPPATVQIGPADDAPIALETEPLLYISPREVQQGDAFVVAVDAPGAGFASVAFDGRVTSLLREGTRFFTVLGIGALTPTGPMPIVVAVTNSEGQQVFRRETLITVVASNWATEVVELDQSNQALLDPDIRAEDSGVRGPIQQQETPERHWDGLFEPPVAGVITSNYGLLRSYNYRPPEEYHSGLDFAGENGDPILAPNAGVVAWTGQTQRRGNGILVDHGGGVFSGYYHLSEVFVAAGEIVNRGDFLGRIGATGLSTGPHLHWEIVVHGITVNPVQWIRDQKYPDPLRTFDLTEAVAGPRSGA